jgi:hypothetical protein
MFIMFFYIVSPNGILFRFIFFKLPFYFFGVPLRKIKAEEFDGARHLFARLITLKLSPKAMKASLTPPNL